MNTKVNSWTIKTESPILSEVYQRIAFSFGYYWPASNLQPDVKTINYTDQPYLIFYPDRKEIKYGSDSKYGVENLVCKVVTSVNELIELFKTPPVVTKDMVYAPGVIIGIDGNVTITRTHKFNCKNLTDLIAKMKEFSGQTQKRKLQDSRL